MGLFSIKPATPEDIVPHVQFYSELHTGDYGDAFYVTSAEGRARYGSFNYFVEDGYFMFAKTIKRDRIKLPQGALGDIQYNPAGMPAFDRGAALVRLRVDGDPGNHAARYVETSGPAFETAQSEVEFCKHAIARAAFDYLTGAAESTTIPQRIEAAQAEYDKKQPALDAQVEAALDVMRKRYPK